MPAHELTPPGIDDAESFLHDAHIEIEGRMPWSSNATFLVHATVDHVTHAAIYKPVRGERPLWDFEPGLHRRERAAYVVSEHLGLGIVPPTVIREGPYGEGSVQWFVDADHREHYFTIHEQRPDLHPQLRDIAVFDVVANNTDRKSGHCLLAGDRVFGIDHGLCFAAPFKLRTVIWEFAGEPVPAALVARLRAFSVDLPPELCDLLGPDEIDALRYRAASLATDAVMPSDHTGHRYPWPLI